jgi:hypothetical protein
VPCLIPRPFLFFALIICPILPPSAFLCALKHAPEVTPAGLKISSDDWKLFKEIKDNGKKVVQALKA